MVLYTDGQASALRKGGEVKLEQGSLIYLNDRVRTTQLGKLRVILGDQCSIMIYGNTELKIENEIVDSKPPYIQTALVPIVKTEDARARMAVSQITSPKECHLITPNAILRGVETDVTVSYSHRLGLSEVVSLSGEVELSQINGKASVLLKEHDLSRVTPESAPSNPVALGGGQIHSLLDQYSWPINVPKISSRHLPWRVITKSKQ